MTRLERLETLQDLVKGREALLGNWLEVDFGDFDETASAGNSGAHGNLNEAVDFVKRSLPNYRWEVGVNTVYGSIAQVWGDARTAYTATSDDPAHALVLAALKANIALETRK